MRYTTTPRPSGNGRRDTWAGGAGKANDWQRERTRGPILPMEQPSWWRRIFKGQ